LRALFGLRRKNEDLGEELEQHLELAVADYESRGLSLEEARRAALREFGNVESLKEDCRDSWGVRLLSNLFRDLNYGWRNILGKKSLSATIIATFAICISLNALMFSLFYSLYLNPGLYPNEDRVVRIADHFEGNDSENRNLFTGPLYYLERKEQSSLLESIGFYQSRFATISELDGEPNPQYNLYYRFSPSLFDVLGVKPFLGRAFDERDSIPGNHRVALLDYRLWVSRYGGRSDVIGKRFELAGTQSEGGRDVYTITGVMPEEFLLPSEYESTESIRRQSFPVYIPWVEQNWHRSERGRRFNYGGSLALLKEEASIEGLKNELKLIAARNGPNYPNAYEFEQSRSHQIRVLSLRSDLVRNVKTELVFLGGAVIIILVLGCVNIASLILSRNRKRVPELVIRCSLGASRGRILFQLMSESSLLAVLGGLLGLAIAVTGLGLVPQTDLLEQFVLDPKLSLRQELFWFVLLLSLGSGVVTGILAFLPLMAAMKSGQSLREDGRGATKTFKGFQSGLVWAQITASMILLIFCGLLLKSFLQILRTDPGFDVENVLTATFRLADSDYDNAAKRRFMGEILRKAREIPGVESAGIEFYPPLKWGGNGVISMISERNWRAGEREPILGIIDSVDTGLFDALSIPLLRGRGFEETDMINMSRVVVIDRTMADMVFPGSDPVGQQIALKGPGQPFDSLRSGDVYTIVGVVGDVRRTNLIKPADMGTVYRHCYDLMPVWISIVAKVEGDPRSILGPLREAIATLDPKISIGRPETMAEILEKNYKSRKYLVFMIVGIAIIALMLSSMGLYGVIGYLVSANRIDIGIRSALGALPRDLRNSVLAYWMRIACVSVLSGLIFALFAAPYVRNLLYEVDPRDPVTLVFAAVFIAFVVLASAWLPSSRATRVSPLRALREE